MGRQEEIREVLARADFESLGHKPSRWDKITDTERNVFYYRIDTYHLPALHSQGAMIRVDRKIGFASVEGTGRELWYEGYRAAMDDYKEAGYEAVESLIKEE